MPAHEIRISRTDNGDVRIGPVDERQQAVAIAVGPQSRRLPVPVAAGPKGEDGPAGQTTRLTERLRIAAVAAAELTGVAGRLRTDPLVLCFGLGFGLGLLLALGGLVATALSRLH
ncbi:hypothetical protein [Kitasatospora sp. MBT63]|uniref:hypothetical protein n=1 Tax=Kitasatospora sp. MBT63 TaxID=1444768 RepID=UPI00053B89E3|nr:hypothetical protein [Kitasatospora sp. MBT63]